MNLSVNAHSKNDLSVSSQKVSTNTSRFSLLQNQSKGKTWAKTISEFIVFIWTRICCLFCISKPAPKTLSEKASVKAEPPLKKASAAPCEKKKIQAPIQILHLEKKAVKPKPPEEKKIAHKKGVSLAYSQEVSRSKVDELLELAEIDFPAFAEQFFALNQGQLHELSKKCARNAAFAPIVRLIKAYYLPKNSTFRSDLFNVLCVLFGIKPANEFCRLSEGKDYFASYVMTPLLKMNPSCTWRTAEDGFRYFSNENPLAFFHPKRYIQDLDRIYPSLSDAVIDGMRSEENSDRNAQILSYVLGYGPAWEAFATRWPHKDENGEPLYVPGKKAPLIFTDEHYHQVGEAILHTQSKSIKARTVSREECIKIGKEYSSTFMERMSSSEGKAFTIDDIMNKLHMEFVIDEIVRYTEYFRMNVAYRKKLMTFMKQVINRIVPENLVGVK